MLEDSLVAQKLDFTRQIRDLLQEKAALLETLGSTQQSLKELAATHAAAVRHFFYILVIAANPN